MSKYKNTFFSSLWDDFWLSSLFEALTKSNRDFTIQPEKETLFLTESYRVKTRLPFVLVSILQLY